MGVMTKSMLWTSVFLLGSAVAIAGCGGDDDDSGDAGGVGTGGIGAGTGGVGTGTGGTTGTGGMTGGTGGMSSVMSVACGANTCMGAGGGMTIPGIMLAAPCCVDMTAGTCGTMQAGVCTPPPAADPDCPTVSVIGMTMASCCAAGNLCGIDASMLGMGCVDFDMVRASPFGAILMPPPATTCDGMPVAGEDDGGAPSGNDGGQ
jgi:hypothetical protein